MVERYACDPYGTVTIWNEARTSTIAWANSKQNEVLFCGYRFDPESGLYHVRHRVYHPTLGRWLQRDPLGYVDGMGLYEYCQGGPGSATDPSGLSSRTQLVTAARNYENVCRSLAKNLEAKTEDEQDSAEKKKLLNAAEKLRQMADRAARIARLLEQGVGGLGGSSEDAPWWQNALGSAANHLMDAGFGSLSFGLMDRALSGMNAGWGKAEMLAGLNNVLRDAGYSGPERAATMAAVGVGDVIGATNFAGATKQQSFEATLRTSAYGTATADSVKLTPLETAGEYATAGVKLGLTVYGTCKGIDAVRGSTAGSGLEWRGSGPPESGRGAWYDPSTQTSLHPDMTHPPPVGAHWDVSGPEGSFRVYPDGRIVPKS